MKKILLFCAAVALSTLAATAQEPTRPSAVKPTVIKKSPAPVLKGVQPVKDNPTPPPPSTPPPAPPPPAQAPTTADYKLTDVRVKITTGRDNKESPSEVYVKFSLPEQFNASYCAFAQWNLQNEMPVNSDIEVGLYKRANANLSLISTKLTMSNPEELRTGGKDISLSDIQAHGGRLKIKYFPHLFTDAWRIENVTITLEFKNQQNELHPVYGRKTISFSNARTFLNAGNERYLVCEVGTDLSAMVSYPGK